MTTRERLRRVREREHAEAALVAAWWWTAGLSAVLGAALAVAATASDGPSWVWALFAALWVYDWVGTARLTLAMRRCFGRWPWRN